MGGQAPVTSWLGRGCAGCRLPGSTRICVEDTETKHSPPIYLILREGLSGGGKERKTDVLAFQQGWWNAHFTRFNLTCPEQTHHPSLFGLTFHIPPLLPSQRGFFSCLTPHPDVPTTIPGGHKDNHRASYYEPCKQMTNLWAQER